MLQEAFNSFQRILFKRFFDDEPGKIRGTDRFLNIDKYKGTLERLNDLQYQAGFAESTRTDQDKMVRRLKCLHDCLKFVLAIRDVLFLNECCVF